MNFGREIPVIVPAVSLFSRLCAGARNDRLVPALEGVSALGKGHVQCCSCEIDGHKCGDISHRKISAGHEWNFVEAVVEVGIEIGNTAPAAIDEFRDLLIVMRAGKRAAFEAGYRVANTLHGWGE